MSEPATLILLPGLDGTEIFFRPLLAELPEWVRPAVVQYPIGGDASYAGLLALVRRAAAGTAGFHVLGWSFSGPLALMLAAAEPDRVRGVILVATFVRPPHRWMRWGVFAIAGPPMWAWRLLRRLPLWFLRARNDPMRSAKTETWRRIPAGALARRLRTIAGADAVPALRACRAPVLHLVSSRDAVVPRRCADDIVRERPEVRIAVIEGGHLAMFSNPRPAAQAIVSFISEAGG